MAVNTLITPAVEVIQDIETLLNQIYPRKCYLQRRRILSLLVKSGGTYTTRQLAEELEIADFAVRHATRELAKEQVKLKMYGIDFQREKTDKEYIHTCKRIRPTNKEQEEVTDDSIEAFIQLLELRTENRRKIADTLRTANDPMSREEISKQTDIEKSEVNEDVQWLIKQSKRVSHLADATIVEEEIEEGREGVLEIVVLDEGILQTLHHDWTDDRSKNWRKTLRLLGNHPGKEFTVAEIQEITGNNESQVKRALAAIINLTSLPEYAEAFGCKVTKKQYFNESGRKIIRATFKIEIVGERPIKVRRNRRLNNLPRTPSERVDIQTTQVKNIERGMGVKLCTMPPASARDLFLKAQFIIRDEARMHAIEKLHRAAQEGQAEPAWPVELELDTPNHIQTYLLLEKNYINWALELGFVIHRVAQGYYGIFFLDPEEREAKLREKYAHQPEKLLECLAPVRQFGKRCCDDRIREALDEELKVVLKIVAKKQDKGEKVTTQTVTAEYAKQTGKPNDDRAAKEVRQIIEQSKHEVKTTKCFMRIQPDNAATVDLLLIDTKKWNPEDDIYNIQAPGLSEEELQEAIPDKSGPSNVNARRVLDHLSLHPGRSFTYTILARELQMDRLLIKNIFRRIISKIESKKFQIEKTTGKIRGSNTRHKQSIYTFQRTPNCQEAERQDETPEEFARRVIKGKKYESARTILVLLLRNPQRAFTRVAIERATGLNQGQVLDNLRKTLARYVEVGEVKKSRKSKQGKKGSHTWQIKPEYRANIDYEREDDTEADLRADELMEEPIAEDNTANQELNDILLVAEEIEGNVLAAALGKILGILLTERDLQQTNMLNREKARRLFSILFIFAERNLLTEEANRALSEHRGHILENISRGGSEADFRTWSMLKQCRGYLLRTYYTMGDEEKAIFMQNKEGLPTPPPTQTHTS